MESCAHLSKLAMRPFILQCAFVGVVARLEPTGNVLLPAPLRPIMPLHLLPYFKVQITQTPCYILVPALLYDRIGFTSL